MLALADLQGQFSAALLDADEGVPGDIVGPDGQAAPKRFGVYRNNVVVGLVEALMASYPTILKLVGEEFFRAAGALHVRQSPPTSPVLLHYGADFPAFLDGFEPARAVPYLGDVARLERAWNEAYHAADASPLDPAALGGIAPDALANVRFTPHPAMRIVRSAFPIVSIYRANQCDSADDVSLPDGGEDALVTRGDLDVEIRALPAGGAVFIAALAQGASLAEAAQQATASTEAFDLGVNLGGVLEAGAFCGLAGPE
ncbi:MAG: DUF2063 domain-containing protein [Hyphomicrobiales bacterium]|nr:MAG: DUF2063 domain-containing protein [Hyphomicrobiales bacterium]